MIGERSHRTGIRTNRIGMIAVLAGALISVAEGFSSLACASRPSVIITIAGAFGAGAALTALIVQRRASASASR